MSGVLMNLISQLQAVEHGQLIDKARVVDHLLDLRGAADSDLSVVTAIDQLLIGVPGLSMVESAWWTEALDGLEVLANRELAY